MELDNGYPVSQINGQLKYGPPIDWSGDPPPKGCEVFVTKLPRDCFQNELVPIFSSIGKLYELRLMMNFSGGSKGYAFITYTNKSDATESVKRLNNYEIRPGCRMVVLKSVDNCRLFIGHVPKNKGRDEIFAEMSKLTEGVKDVIVYPDTVEKSKYRGYAFVDYDSHRSAAMARRKLIPARVQLWGTTIQVDWAEPEPEVDEEIMSSVKNLYVRNLALKVTEDRIREVFTAAALKRSYSIEDNDSDDNKDLFIPRSEHGHTKDDEIIERVKKIKDYAFVHFINRTYALTAMEELNGANLDGAVIEVTLAKPVDKTVRAVSQTYQQQLPSINGQHRTVFPFNPSSLLGSALQMSRTNVPLSTSTNLTSLPPEFEQSLQSATFGTGVPAFCTSPMPLISSSNQNLMAREVVAASFNCDHSFESKS